MIPENEIVVKSENEPKDQQWFLKREYLISVHNMVTSICRMFYTVRDRFTFIDI